MAISSFHKVKCWRVSRCVDLILCPSYIPLQNKAIVCNMAFLGGGAERNSALCKNWALKNCFCPLFKLATAQKVWL